MESGICMTIGRLSKFNIKQGNQNPAGKSLYVLPHKWILIYNIYMYIYKKVWVLE